MTREAAQALVGRLRGQGIELRASAGKLMLVAPKGAVTAALAAEIKGCKEEIIEMIEGDNEIAPAARGAPVPLGPVQERIWAHAQMEPETLLYNLPAAWRFKGPLDEAAFCEAFDDFVARHEILRLRIVMADGLPWQTFLPAKPGALAMEDMSAFDPPARERRLGDRIEELRTAPMDLSAGAPFVARLFRLGPFEHALFFMPHHLAWDGWCFDIFLRDLRELYLARIEARAPCLPALAIQYADYAIWHRRRVESGGFAADLLYWEKTLGDPPPPPNLPADRARPDLFRARGDWTQFPIDAALLGKVKDLAATTRATSFMTFLTLWRVFLTRICGDRDIVIGAPIQARQHADVADVVGCFVNTIFLRQKVDPTKSLSALLKDARDICLEAYQRQEAPVEALAHKLAPRDPSRTPLAQVMFTHQHIASRPRDFGAAALSQIHVNPRMSPTDIMLAVMEGGEAARGLIHFATDIISAPQAECIARAFQVFAKGALDHPDTDVARIALVDQSAVAHGAALLSEARPTLLEMIAQTAARAPNAIAVRAGPAANDYAQLMARSAALANWLAVKNVKAGDIVGLMMPRGVDMIALALAVWRRGAAYLPLDPAYPAQRLAYMVEDSGARLIVSTSDVAEIEGAAAQRANVDAEADEIVRAPAVAPEVHERAYVIYTSGSTGKPKGVENSHRSLSNFIRSMIETPGLGPRDRLLAVTTLSFDISILELFAPLAAGAEVVIASVEEAADGEALARLIEERRPTVLQATPASWRLLLDSGLEARGLKALCGGEAMGEGLAQALLPKVGELWNMYGPTETTVWSTMKKIERAEAITIGAPIDATHLYIVGPGDQLMPDGVAGELWIGGEGVAIGYLNRPELTRERFIADPFGKGGRKDGRVYRTGDLARRLPNGEIEHLGRIDAQVKLRGFRIEPGEIEAAIEAHEAVARAIAAVKKDASGEPTLVAYVLYKDGMSATGSELRRLLRQTLPNYMLPQLFVEIAKVPLTSSGKVDRGALPDPAGGGAPRQRTAPRTETEAAIAAIWRDILKVSDISVTDNFFELGGQSLQAAQMTARYRAATAKRLAPRSVIFETLEQLAAGVDQGG